ncbi:MAG: class II aldolase/adducin family protein [Phycisphaerae bacterium]|nr:class II aldolase/adducin family protein [Phycisphaerae bacterium]
MYSVRPATSLVNNNQGGLAKETLYRSQIRTYNASMQSESAKKEFVGACHKVAGYGLVSCSSGNLSWQIEPDTVLLSASGSWLAELTVGQVAACEIESGQCLNGKVPTCESVYHLGILKNRPEVNVVLHFQSPYATAIACGETDGINFNMTIEVPVYIGTPAIVPYLPPGSDELARAVIDVFKDSETHLAILKNHGLISVGKDFNDAIQKAVFFEMACRIILTDPNAKPLDDDAVKRLHKVGAKA